MPTYYVTKADDGTEIYHCCYCEQAGQEHHSTDRELFEQHQQQRHDGRMVEDTDASAAARKPTEEHPQGGPPGQTGEHPEHPHGGPPGQEKPPEATVDPDAPHVEHHEDTPERTGA